jgi:hypothetical protein
MVRITLLAAALLLSVDATALACSSPSCVPTKAKPADVKQFMRDQAASTRGKTLNLVQAANKPASQSSFAKQRPLPVVSHSRKPLVKLSDQHLGKTYRAKSSKNKSPQIFASRPKSIATSPRGAAFEPPKLPVVEVVSDEQFNSIDQTVSAFDAAPPAADLSAQAIVAEAFAEIERKPEGSLEPNDLLAADERASQNPSLLRWIWSTLGIRF